MEAKPVSIALHYRQTPQLETEIFKLGRELARRYGLHTLRGKCLLELIAPGARNKGETIALLAKQLQAEAVIYFGDDHTDETVFALRSIPLLSVFVAPGKGEKRAAVPKSERHMWPTRAKYWLAGPEEVVTTLQALARPSRCHSPA